MYAPHQHEAFVTISDVGEVTYHDTMEDAVLDAILRNVHIYEAEFTPIYDVRQVVDRYHDALINDVALDVDAN